MVEGNEILACATREIGYHEGTGKHNKYGEWYGMDGVAWCMEFVQWVYHQCHADLPFKTPSCGGLLNWYKRNQPECITKEPIRGCVVIFDFPGTKYSTDHTGLFISTDGRKITTIDGNTGDTSDANGGGVQQKTRNLSYANPTYIIPRGLVLVDWDRAINEMTDEQAVRLQDRVNRAISKLPASGYAEEACRKAVASGYFADGNKDGTLDKPRCPITREEFAVVQNREGMFEKAVKRK